MVREGTQCGVSLGGHFFPLARAFDGHGEGCYITLESPLPSGRFQPVHASLGMGDDLQAHWVFALLDLTTETLVPLGDLDPEWRHAEVVQTDDPGGAGAREGVGALNIEADLEHAHNRAGGVPWTRSRSLDLLYLKRALLDLRTTPPRVLNFPDKSGFIAGPVVFLR